MQDSVGRRRATGALPPLHVPAPVREPCRWLLLTWPIRAARGLVTIPERRLLTLDGREPLVPEGYPPRSPLTDPKRAALLLEIAEDIEHTCGDGHYDDRRGLLETTVTRTRANLDSVCEALQQGRQAQHESLVTGHELDQLRKDLSRRDRRVVAAKRTLTSLRDWYACEGGLYRFHALGLPTIQTIPLRIETHTVSFPAIRGYMIDLLNATLLVLDHDPWLTAASSRPLRRQRRGAPEQPWLRRVRRQLGRLKIPKETREDFLLATGLIPYRPQ